MLPPFERQATKVRMSLGLNSSISQCWKHPKVSITAAPLQQLCKRVLLLLLVPQTNLSEDESRGTPEKLSQSRDSVGDGPETSSLVLVGWLKARPLCSDGVGDAIVADATGGRAEGLLQSVANGIKLHQSFARPTIKVA